MSFFMRWIITAVAVGVAIWFVPGIAVATTGAVNQWAAIIIFALFLALINVTIKPILQVLSIPITVLTLGIFYLVVNTLMLYLAAFLADKIFDVAFYIQDFPSAFIASIIISVVSAILNSITGAKEH